MSVILIPVTKYIQHCLIYLIVQVVFILEVSVCLEVLMCIVLDILIYVQQRKMGKSKKKKKKSIII